MNNIGTYPSYSEPESSAPRRPRLIAVECIGPGMPRAGVLPLIQSASAKQTSYLSLNYSHVYSV